MIIATIMILFMTIHTRIAKYASDKARFNSDSHQYANL